MAEQTPAVGMARKLAAIFSTDVAGYSRLMGDDEEATIRTLTACRALISSLIQQYRGRVVDAPGDNLLAEFASVVDAVRCAVEIQHELKVKNAELPDTRRMQFRIGINLGDVVVEGERLYGDGVNIAARMESLAEPGGICIAGIVYDQVENKLALTYEYQGEQTVKNIAKPVRVYRVVLDATAAVLAEQAVLRHAQHERLVSQAPVTLSPSKPVLSEVEGGDRSARTMRPPHRWVTAGLLLIVATIGAVWYYSRSLLAPPTSLLTQEAKPPALPLPDKPSLVVLPFVNMSKDPDQDYFSDGITEDLTSDLSKLSGLFVISRNSAFTYKGKPVKAQEVSKELGVRYLLEGSVRKADDQVRITAQLIDATTGSHQWAERYDRPLKDIFALQDEIVQKIVANLQVEVLEAELARVRRIPTDNLTAYDSVLRGWEAFSRFTKEAHAQARQMFERAIKLDPQYAQAYVSLGGTYYIEWVWRWSADPQTLERAFELAQKAVILDDSLPDAHGLLGNVYAVKKQYDQALVEGERAIALDPNSADSYAQQAEGLNFAGRSEEALRSVEQAMRLNPRYPAWYLIQAGWAYHSTGRYEEAIAALKTLLLQNPNFLTAYLHLAVSYLRQWAFQLSQDPQTLEQAVTMTQKALILNESLPSAHMMLGYIYLWQKQYEQAIAEMEQAITLDPQDATGYALLAEVLSCVGRSEEALEAAEKALRLKPQVADGHLAGVATAYVVAGRYEEAQPLLQRFLSRYPNILGAHLTLAVVYSELGQAAEARAEAAEVLRLNPKFSLEVARQRSAIKDPAVLERHIAALRKAGLK